MLLVISYLGFFRAEYLDDVALYRKLVIVKRVRDKPIYFYASYQGQM